MLITSLGRRLLPVGFTICLSACSVGPDYVKPAAVPEMPVAYREAQGWKLASPADHLSQNWWELFNDPLLNELAAQVAVSNQNVLLAEAQYRQARALIQSARSEFYPTVAVGAAVTASRRSANLGGGSVSGGNSTMFQLPVDLAWEIDLWGRVRRSVEASQARAQASEADLAAVRLSMQTELAIAYLQLLTVDQQKRLLDESVANYRKTLELTRNRYAGGVVARADVLQAESQLSSTEAQAIDTGIQRAQLEHAIALLVGRPASGFSLPVGNGKSTVPAVPTGLPSDLLERRPDIASAERQMAAANAQIGLVEAAWYPSLRLTASGGLEASSLARWLTWPSRFWAVGPAISETVFDGGLRRAQDKQVRAIYEASMAAYRQTVLTGFKEVEDNLAALRMLEQEARLQDQAVLAARQAVVITSNQYRAGTTAYLNVLVVQTTELANQRVAIDIQGRRLVASVLLIKALGGGWQVNH